MATFSSFHETRSRLEKLIADTEAPRWRLGLEDFLQHWWAEVIGDLDAAMAAFESDVVFRTYGSMGTSEEFTLEQRKAVYQAIQDAGMCAGGSWDNERFYFGDAGISMDATWTFVHYGAMLADHPEPVDPGALYLVQRPLNLQLPLTEEGHLVGEILYAGHPSLVEPIDPARKDDLLGSLK
ncbi:hypothetical protein [Nocardia aurea]|uniref:hypothetical protein n=1 Tax=Nocardia aurea TaxID=2144174 RepID=UPI000D69995E|nr:hypothetical protein [Nocardia aurea]